MFKTILIGLMVCLLGSAQAAAQIFAAAAEPTLELRRDSDWKSYDDLIAGAKTAMMANPEAALQQARIARTFAQTHSDSSRWATAFATGLWLEAEALSRMNRVDEAQPLLDRAIQIAGRGGKPAKLNGDLALSLARIAVVKGDIALSLKSYHDAHRIFAAIGDARGQAMALQGLGSIYDQAHDFARSIEYYRKAVQVYSGDAAVDLAAANNVGFALQELGRYDEAIAHFRRALEIGKSLNSPFLRARVLTNLAVVYTRRHQFDAAEAAADEALRLLGRGDESGWSPFVWGVKAQLEYERQSIDDAAIYLDQAFRGIDVATTISPFRDLHEVAYKVYRAKGDYSLALAHLEAFSRGQFLRRFCLSAPCFSPASAGATSRFGNTATKSPRPMSR
jgi:tetratricopeptide (TPR) repeat protein